MDGPELMAWAERLNRIKQWETLRNHKAATARQAATGIYDVLTDSEARFRSEAINEAIKRDRVSTMAAEYQEYMSKNSVSRTSKQKLTD